MKVNVLLRDFIKPASPPRTDGARQGPAEARALHLVADRSRPRTARRRDRGRATKLHPDLEIDWLAQHPVTAVLEARGERVHPASEWLSNESGHMESESAEHDLHCFQAWRRMDEILLANYMVFHDVVRDDQYDLWIGDEAWELDYYLHENPEEKRAAYVWLTDFIGWLPMEDGAEHEAYLRPTTTPRWSSTSQRFLRVRDRALYVGNLEDVTPEPRPRAAVHPRLDEGALRVPGLRDGVRSSCIRRP